MSDRYGSITIGGDKPEQPSKKQRKPLPKRLAPSPKKKVQSKRPLWFALIAFFCIASYFLAGIYLAPMAIQKYLPRYIQNKTGLTLKIGRSQLNPVNFQLTLEQIVADLPKSPAKDPLLKIESLFIDLDLTALVRNTFACDKLTIENLRLTLIRHKDKSYNIPVLSNFSTTQQQGEIINFAKLPFLFSLNNIAINESRILFTDEITEKSHNIEKLQLAIPTLSNFSFQSKNYITPHFSAIINGSPIQLSGEAVQLAEEQGFQTKLSCSIQSLDLVPYFSYLPSSFPMVLSKGRADSTLQIAFAPNKKQGERLSIDIQMTAADLELKGKNNVLQITVPAMKMDAALRPINKQLHIKNIITIKTHLLGNTEQLNAAFQNLFSSLHKGADNGSSITIDQLLADQGQLTLDGDSKWHSLQLSIKDFHSSQGSGNIQLSGEQTGGKGSFSWQGKFAKPGKVQGKLLLNAFPAEMLFNRLLPDSSADQDIQGSATFSGDLSFLATEKPQPLLSIDNGILQFQKLKLNHKKDTWLTSDSVRLTRLSRTDGRYNLGNIFLKDATLRLKTAKLPPLFKQLFTEANRPQIQGIDFSGEIQLRGDTGQDKMLQISGVQFQLNKLEKTSPVENFAFTGNLGTEGILKAKGIFNLAPLQLQANLAFSDVDSSLLSPFFSKWPLLQNSTATLHGKGSYRFPTPSFHGDLRLSDTLLQKTSKTPLLRWDLAELKNLSCSFSPFSLQADTLVLDKAALHWQRDKSSPFHDLHQGLHGIFQKNSKKNMLFPVVIKKTSITNASLTMVDKRVTPAWESTVAKLEGYINNFNTTEKGLSSFTINGMMEGSAITLSGAITLLQKEADGRARLKLTNFPLAALHNQLRQLPIKTDSAKLDLDMNMTESQSQFSSKNELLLKNLFPLSTPSDTALALAFLQNPSGSVPLTVQIENSDRSLLQESVASFQTTVIKASYAPLLLDRSFKDLQDKDLVPFQPGTSTISSTGREILSRYAALLEQHPGLSLSLTGMADGKTDRAILQKTLEALEQQRVDKENSIGLAEYRKKQQALLAPKPSKTLQEEDIAKKDLAGYIPLLTNPVHVSDKALLDLARERNLIVYNFCIHNLGIAPERLVAKKEKITGDTPSNGVRIAIKAIARDVN